MDFSSGGGLLWLRAPRLSLNGSLLSADGLDGAMATSGKNSVATGGGAGGQILVYTQTLEALGRALSS